MRRVSHSCDEYLTHATSISLMRRVSHLGLHGADGSSKDRGYLSVDDLSVHAAGPTALHLLQTQNRENGVDMR
jgi:hypothetical protein